jgi:hypothetical protein
VSFRNALLNYTENLASHAVFQNNYFDFLKLHKFSAKLYEFHRANFFFRTEATVKSVANVCAKAASEDDQDTLILFSYILNEECGEGDKQRSHELLMEQSHNTYGDSEFNLAPLKVKDAKFLYPNGLIIKETKHYREKVNILLNKNYATMLGAAFALETHASFMLSNLREIFSISQNVMRLSEYKNRVEVYFNVHLDSGIEDRHAADCKRCILNNCNSEQDLFDIMHGINEMLSLQKIMWDGMYHKAKQMTLPMQEIA